MNANDLDLSTIIGLVEREHDIILLWLNSNSNFRVRKDPELFIVNYNRLVLMYQNFFSFDNDGIINREILYDIVVKMSEWFEYANEVEMRCEKVRRNPSRNCKKK